MNKRESLYDVKSFYNKGAKLKASFQGMRYQVEGITLESDKEEGQEEKKLLVSIWPEPFCFEKANPVHMKKEYFPYEEDGLDQVYNWLCKEYEHNQSRWEHARDFPMDEILGKNGGWDGI